MKDTVAIVFTGGTISMTIDPRIGAAIPSLSGEQIMSMVTNIDKIASTRVINFSEIPGYRGQVPRQRSNLPSPR